MLLIDIGILFCRFLPVQTIQAVSSVHLVVRGAPVLRAMLLQFYQPF
ncbi:hypothetical protein ACO0LM_25635 [Undibacterium sp. Di26W]